MCLFFTYRVFMVVFEDELFSKEDAIELLEEQNLFLKDNFKIDNNKFSSAIGEYYHTFTLSISEKDKNRLIEEIQSETDFKGTGTEELLYSSIDKYNGPKVSQNYKTELYYVREYLEPNGAGYAPTFRKISISKKENKIKFEDIDD